MIKFGVLRHGTLLDPITVTDFLQKRQTSHQSHKTRGHFDDSSSGVIRKQNTHISKRPAILSLNLGIRASRSSLAVVRTHSLEFPCRISVNSRTNSRPISISHCKRRVHSSTISVDFLGLMPTRLMTSP